MQLTPLQQKTTRDILFHIRQEHYEAGHHLTASALANHLEISRSPVNAALSHLAQIGIVNHDRNRGFFLAYSAHELSSKYPELFDKPDDQRYQKIVDLRFDNKLPDQILETDLMRILDTSRANVKKVLSRIQEEGWIERRPGKGWEFLSLIDSKEAYEESYLYRLVIEPAALLSPKFMVDKKELKDCLNKQQLIVEQGYLSMTPVELFEANSHFHETLARWSNNRFLYQSVVRLNKLRRLVEYRQASLRTPRKKQSEEHIKILESIANGDQIEAASLLRQHLNQAKNSKINYFE